MPQDRLMASLRASAQVFEAHIYPTDHRLFGREWTPGIDRDPRLTILCLNLAGSGAGGYYSAEDLYPRVVNAYSNERKTLYVGIDCHRRARAAGVPGKTLYVGIDSYPLGTAGFAATLAHEFQHMIHWYHHERDDAWINEGSSMLAQALTGYTADGLDQSFAAAPATQLDAFCYDDSSCADTSTVAPYGAAFQWMVYFYQHYGGDRALHTLLADKALSGMALFDDVLARLGSHDRARDMFASRGRGLRLSDDLCRLLHPRRRYRVGDGLPVHTPRDGPPVRDRRRGTAAKRGNGDLDGDLNTAHPVRGRSDGAHRPQHPAWGRHRVVEQPRR